MPPINHINSALSNEGDYICKSEGQLVAWLAGAAGLFNILCVCVLSAQLHEDKWQGLDAMAHDLCQSGNCHQAAIEQRCEGLQEKRAVLVNLARRRKSQLDDNSDYLRFMWKTDVVEAWISEREARIEQNALDGNTVYNLRGVQMLLKKHEVFVKALENFHLDGIRAITFLHNQLIENNHVNSALITQRYVYTV